MRPTITQQLTEERIKQLKAIEPARERAFRELTTLKKERIDCRTITLIRK